MMILIITIMITLILIIMIMIVMQHILIMITIWGTSPACFPRPEVRRCMYVCMHVWERLFLSAFPNRKAPCMLSRLASSFQPSQRLCKSLGVQQVCMHVWVWGAIGSQAARPVGSSWYYCRENGKGGMRKGGIGQVNRNTQQTNTNKLEFPIPPFLIPPFPISQYCVCDMCMPTNPMMCTM